MKGILPYEFIRKRVSVTIAVLFVFTVAMLVVFTRAEMTGFFLLYVLSRFMFIIVAFSAVVAFISCSLCWRSGTEEVISAYRGIGYYQHFTANTFFVISIVYQLIIIAFLFIASINNDGTRYFLTYFWKSYFCNIFLPLEISLFVAYLLSQMRQIVASSTLLILFLVMVSPIYSMLSWQSEPAFPIDKIVAAIFHPFRILYENGTYAANPQLGLQTDSARLLVLAFWVLLLAALAIILLCRRKILRITLAAIFFAGGICCLGLSYLPSSAYRINGNWDGTMEDFYTYYDQETGLNISDDTYSITDYSLDISLGRTMTVDADLHLEADSPQEEFAFTLYHGYEIRSLSSDDASVTWTADGDYVTVATAQPVSELDLKLNYRGSHNIFFSYGEGCLLPGWFPWYPMAGEKQVFVNYEMLTSGYNTFNRIDEANISVSVNSNFAMASNLEEISDGCYEGVSDSITLIGGEILLSDDSQVKDFLPLDLTVSGEEYVSDLSAQWQGICDELEDYGVGLPAPRDSKIIVASRDMCRFYSADSAAVFGDYVLTYTDGLTIENISQQMILGKNPDSMVANIACSLGGLYDTPEETLEFWMQSLYFLAEDAEWEHNDTASLMYQALASADENGEGEELVREIAQFLCSEDAENKEEEFLEEACGRYGAD